MIFQLRKDCKLSFDLNTKWQEGVKNLRNLKEFHDTSVYTGTSGIALLHLRKDPDNLEVGLHVSGFI